MLVSFRQNERRKVKEKSIGRKLIPTEKIIFRINLEGVIKSLMVLTEGNVFVKISAMFVLNKENAIYFYALKCTTKVLFKTRQQKVSLLASSEVP